ncbi:MAG: hypothetical protein ACYS21_18170 [Planctomycetota bacterium]|jgi:hypothetical protein
MRETAKNSAQRKPSYAAGSVLLVFNGIAFLISIIVLVVGLTELHSESEQWNAIGYSVAPGVLILIQLILLLPLTIISLVRRRSAGILRLLNSVVLLFGIAGSASALGLLVYCTTFEGRKPHGFVSSSDVSFWFPISDYGGSWKYNASPEDDLEYSWLVEVDCGSKKYEVGVTAWSGGKHPSVVGFKELIDQHCQSNIWDAGDSFKSCVVEGQVSEALVDEGVLVVVEAPWFVKELRERKPKSVLFRTGGALHKCRKESVDLVYDPNL